MHEFSIAESILNTVEERLGEKKELVTATLTVGLLSGVNPEALKFCFAELADQRGFGRPRLIVNEVPAKLHCSDCGEDYQTRDMALGCPRCSSWNRRILGGRECMIENVEVRID